MLAFHVRTVGLAVTLVAVVLVSGLPGPVPLPARIDPTRMGAVPLTSALPAALQQPWAARAGFDAVQVAQVQGARPASEPTVRIVVTLWPTDPGFYSIGAAGGAPLTSAELAARYAPSPAAYAALATYFTGRGLTIDHRWADGLFLTVRGSPAQIGSAFGTALMDGTWQGRPVLFPQGAPSLPAPFQSEVAAVSGLSSGFSQFLVPFQSLPAQGRTTTLVTPSAVHLLYDLNGLYNHSATPQFASGQSIALVLWGSGYDPTDLQTFFANYYPAGFPSLTLNAYPVDGAPNPSASAVNDPANVTSEMTLDLEWSGSAAPGATLDAVYAPDGPSSNNYSPSDANLEDALNTAVQSVGAHVVSMSFGTPDGSDPSFQAAFTTTLADAQARGVTVLAASGDTGGTAKLGCSGGLSPEFPAASPYVLAVGGTAPVVSENALGQVTGLDSEPAWNRSGGGYSVEYADPSWQLVGSAAGPIGSAGKRGFPDVAGPAQDNMFYYNGQVQAGAGTSFASPMWAGVIAEMDALRGSSLGFVTPRLYTVGASEAGRSSADGLVDITSGSNCVSSATAGWDAATGWGTPRAGLLYEDLSATFVDVTLTLSQSSVVPGASFGASVSVTNATSHAPLRALSVNFSLDSPGYVGPCGGAIATVGGSTDANGNATSNFSVPSCYLGSSLEITATVSGAYFGSNSTTVHVNLLGLAGFLAFVQVFPYNVITFVVIIAIATLIGWRIGERRRRRAQRSRAPPVVAGGPSPGAPRGPAPPSPPSAAPRAAIVPPASGSSTPVASAAPPPTARAPPNPPPASSSPALSVETVTTAPIAAETEPVVVPDHVAAAEGWGAPPEVPLATPRGEGESDLGEAPDHVSGVVGAAPAPIDRTYQICPACRAPVPLDASHCPACGAEVNP